MSPKSKQLEERQRGVTPSMRRNILDGNGIGWCHYYGYPGYEIDHVVPRSRGGGLDPENLVVACSECNGEKSDLTADEWAQARVAAGKPWPIPNMDARIVDMVRRDEPWPWAPALDLGYREFDEWLDHRPGGKAALRRYLVAARDRAIEGGR